jgi:hypothetical protein
MRESVVSAATRLTGAIYERDEEALAKLPKPSHEEKCNAQMTKKKEPVPLPFHLAALTPYSILPKFTASQHAFWKRTKGARLTSPCSIHRRAAPTASASRKHARYEQC